MPLANAVADVPTAAGGVPAAGTRSVHLDLASTPAAASLTRRLVQDACRAWNLEHLAGPAALVISELVTNAVQHAGTDLRVSAVFEHGYLCLSVRDGSRRAPTPTAFDPYRGASLPHLPEHGRGLHLIGAYASAWGCSPTGNGKVVWATMSATGAAAR